MKETCFWVSHFRSNFNKKQDIHIAKIRRLNDDGTEERLVKIIRDFKRPFWITKPEYRNHEQKKLYEIDEKLDLYTSTQAGLAYAINGVLKIVPPGVYISPSTANQSPYVYGTDVSGASIIKNQYLEAHPDYRPPADFAVADYETDVVNSDPNDKVIISGAIAMKNQWLVIVDKRFINDGDVEAGVKRVISKYKTERLKKLVELYGEPEIKVIKVDDEISVVKTLMGTAHEWKPDYLVWWNMKFDIEAMESACSRAGVPCEDIFCDPRVPEEFRSYRFVEDVQQKEKANGDVTSKDFVDLWHKVIAAASFTFVDGMSFFRLKTAMALGKLPSYTLEDIGKRLTGYGKLKDTEADQTLNGLDWHQEMQRNNKLFYLTYNLMDCLLYILMDSVSKDISVSFSTWCKTTEYRNANKNPKRLCDDAHFRLRKQKRVICSTSDNMTHPFDLRVLDKRNWIITLASERVHGTGVSMVKGIPDSASRISVHGGDIDVESGYPTSTIALNASSSTTRFEAYAIEGVSEATLRMCAVNLVSLKVNCVDIAHLLMGAPRISDLLDVF